jgi:hypothetical protein
MKASLRISCYLRCFVTVSPCHRVYDIFHKAVLNYVELSDDRP